MKIERLDFDAMFDKVFAFDRRLDAGRRYHSSLLAAPADLAK